MGKSSNLTNIFQMGWNHQLDCLTWEIFATWDGLMIASTQVEVGSVLFFFVKSYHFFGRSFLAHLLWYRKKQAQWVFMVVELATWWPLSSFFSISLTRNLFDRCFFPKDPNWHLMVHWRFGLLYWIPIGSPKMKGIGILMVPIESQTTGAPNHQPINPLPPSSP